MPTRISIVGQKHRGLDPYLVGIQAGIPVMLVREPNNQYDVFAVAVYVEGKHVGYLPKRDNVEIAKRIDATGTPFIEYATSNAREKIALDAMPPKTRVMRAIFARSPNSAYPQVEID